MRLYIVRHAWAEEPGDFRYPNDSDRPLTEEGRKRFRRVVSKLVARGFQPQQIATSPYVRTVQTAEIIAKSMPKEIEVATLPALAPGARINELLEWTATLSVPEVAWVGHMPDVGDLTSILIGAATNRIGFSKGAIAAIDFNGRAEIGRGILCWLLTAKMLGC